MRIYTKIVDIESFLAKSDSIFKEAKLVEKEFPFKVTDYFLEKSKGKERLINQFIPKIDELKCNLDIDPFEEEKNSIFKHVIKRYSNRILINSTNQCFIHCRFCTRKRNWQQKPFFFEDIEVLVDFLKVHPEINDVIISGGDPFCLDDHLFCEILNAVSSVESVKIKRIGTRVLSTAPESITYKKLECIKKNKPVWINLHFNHPDEITKDTYEFAARLMDSGGILSSQSVLLKGINDDINILKDLFLKLMECGIRPYYLFSCDPVKGNSHFMVDIDIGISMIKQLRKELGNFCVPYFAVDGKNGKKILA